MAEKTRGLGCPVCHCQWSQRVSMALPAGHCASQRHLVLRFQVTLFSETELAVCLSGSVCLHSGIDPVVSPDLVAIIIWPYSK